MSHMYPSPFAQPISPSGSNIQTSRVRSSLCARDMPLEDFNNMMQDFDVSRSGRSKTLTPSNLEDLFSAKISSSPWYFDPAAASVFSPTHKSAIFNQFQQLQSSLSPINTNVMSPKNVEHPLFHQASYGVSSP
ncbi:hypothetical protein KIW84_040972 [Lathyrus oleraceus]|uniref:Uncharacterized protein n=1 Tax=Pisum sativum TaxID=3888 RepID=A0A9D4XBS2_PEA|nr:hypothetical protein KIW84_040972 [Pisum sativum]